MAKRIRYEVVPITRPLLDRWMVTKNGLKIRYMTYPTKLIAVREAAALARAMLRDFGQRSQLFIKGRNGKIQDERTYGADPRRTKG